MEESFREVGRLEAIWIKRGKLAPMDSVEVARVVAGKGLEGNANQGGKRQINTSQCQSLGRRIGRAWERGRSSKPKGQSPG